MAKLRFDKVSSKGASAGALEARRWRRPAGGTPGAGRSSWGGRRGRGSPGRRGTATAPMVSQDSGLSDTQPHGASDVAKVAGQVAEVAGTEITSTTTHKSPPALQPPPSSPAPSSAPAASDPPLPLPPTPLPRWRRRHPTTRQRLTEIRVSCLMRTAFSPFSVSKCWPRLSLRHTILEQQWATFLGAEDEQLANPQWRVAHGLPASGVPDEIE